MVDSDVLALFGVGEKSAAPLVRARLAEAHWLARFDTVSLTRTLEAHAPGYLDDYTSLRDLMEPYVAELAPAGRDGVR